MCPYLSAFVTGLAHKEALYRVIYLYLYLYFFLNKHPGHLMASNPDVLGAIARVGEHPDTITVLNTMFRFNVA